MRMMMNDKRKRGKIAIFDIICRMVEGGEEGANGTCGYIWKASKKSERGDVVTPLADLFVW